MKTHSPISRLSAALLVSAALLASQTALAQFAYGNAVSASARAKVSAGMTQAQVLSALGKPTRAETYALSQQTSWIYEAADTAIYRDALYYVTFGRDGKVVSAGLFDPGTN